MRKTLIICCIAILTGFIIVHSYLQRRLGGQNFDRLAINIRTACQKEPVRALCYDSALPKLMNNFSMEQIFALAKVIQKQDTSYAYCHVLGHKLSTIETRKDVGKWKDVITRCPSGVCSNGCIHGAFQERFRTETLPDSKIAEIAPELETVCEARGSWTPTGLEKASCYHALGHLLMYITGADAARVVTLCDRIGDKGNNGDFRKVCYDGAFMQIFQPLEPEDRALITGKVITRLQHSTFCKRFPGPKKTACISEGWPLYFDELREPQGLINICSQLSGTSFDSCIDSVLYVLVVQFQFHLPSIRQYCIGLPKKLAGRCFAMTASRLIETDYDNVDTAVAWCKEATLETIDSCFSELVKESDFIFQKGSANLSEFCEKLPEQWRESCLGKKSK